MKGRSTIETHRHHDPQTRVPNTYTRDVSEAS